MAANDELPRGATLNNTATGAPASVTFPAAPEISWVLTSITADMNLGLAAAPASSPIQVTGGITLQPLELSIPTGSPAYTKDSDTWTGSIQGVIGEALTVAFEFSAAGLSETLTVEAYPI